MFPPVVTPNATDPLPAKVQAAIQYLYFAENIRTGQGGFDMLPGNTGDMPRERGRELSQMEASVYYCALATMKEYFNDTAGLDPQQSNQGRGIAAHGDGPPPVGATNT